MKYITILLLTLTACGGAPFVLVDSLPSDEGGVIDAPIDSFKLPTPHLDARVEAAPEAAIAEAGSDATPDAGPDVGIDADAHPESEAEAAPPDACAPMATMTFACGSNMVSANAPTQYCHNTNNFNGMGAAFGTPTSMPLECQCAGAYTCRCLTTVLTRAQLCGGLNFVGCNDTVSGVTIGCL
jgi:hypothetical protein